MEITETINYKNELWGISHSKSPEREKWAIKLNTSLTEMWMSREELLSLRDLIIEIEKYNV